MALLPLKIEGACLGRRGRRWIGPVDLELAGQGTTIVIGPNGSGKTSLLRMMHGLERLREGSLRWSCPLEEARRKQAFVFQTPIMMRRSVLDNLAYPLRLGGMDRKAAQAEAEAWLDRVDLAPAARRDALRLSGGERQKLALARALIRSPEVLFLDEPCAALDGRATREIEAILQGASTSGTRLVMSTHDMGQARRLADEVIFVLGGRVHEYSPADRFFDQPETPQASAFLRGDIVE
ncbi:Glutamine transport ATP-binding protein GlnQ [Tritonibacter multivorans]|uniref:Glutamine transport ATP-binding protein GlnQ n=1 Tax=Tritonibacter multivorans TaxID=928856 RepID=A0A0P1G841_9RHOB|nr:ATP-binding cassette domain-containing protein [Tritonibacter multivorans]MDA7422320.1 ATP-binding cassette domain-containing protein [Tritonibacter multivorans]CUH77731.1 Glutamine transport ATP-binding protein GlnQ [Tritonibacter multivorans]SFD13128.1 tungstate transport system ATP-binding protein [Tritonibacter multivorans]